VTDVIDILIIFTKYWFLFLRMMGSEGGEGEEREREREREREEYLSFFPP